MTVWNEWRSKHRRFAPQRSFFSSIPFFAWKRWYAPPIQKSWRRHYTEVTGASQCMPQASKTNITKCQTINCSKDRRSSGALCLLINGTSNKHMPTTNWICPVKGNHAHFSHRKKGGWHANAIPNKCAGHDHKDKQSKDVLSSEMKYWYWSWYCSLSQGSRRSTAAPQK